MPVNDSMLDGLSDGESGWKLIPAKLEPARRPRGFVSRQRLVEHLGTDLERKVSVLVAPAGYGKTTLLAEWRDALIERNCAVAWLTLDRDDDDPTQFMAYLVAALARCLSAGATYAREITRNDPLAPIGAIVSTLCLEIERFGRPLVLILDDFDSLCSASIHDAMHRLLRYAPDNFLCAVASRVDPPLGLSAFAAAGQLVRIDAGDLRFSEKEAAAFLAETADASLEPAEIATLLAATDGWAAGLQLAALTLPARVKAIDIAETLKHAYRNIDSYLTENVLNDVPSGVADFLLRTSILDALSPALCEAVMGSGDVRGMLDWLEARNLFLHTIDQDRQWYRFHTLFLDYLRRRLIQRLPHEIVSLHRRASEWFAARGQWIEAVKHALAAGDVERATIWVEDGAMTFVERGDARTVLSLVAKLPIDAVRARLRLSIVHTWALALTMQTVEASAAHAKITADLEQLRCELLAVGACIAGLNEDSARALDLGQRALDMQPAHGKWVERIAQTTVIYGLGAAARFEELERFRDAEHAAMMSDESVYAAVYRQTIFGYCSFIEGNLAEAARLLTDALERAEQAVGHYSAAAVLPGGYLSLIAYERGDLARANEMVRGRLALAVDTCTQGSLEGFCLTQARLHVAESAFGAAHELLHRTHAVAEQREWLRLQAACMGENVRLYIRENRLADAAAIGDQIIALTFSKSFGEPRVSIETRFEIRIALSRLQIARHEGAAAVPELRALLLELRSARRAYLAARTALLLAVALDQAGLRAEALDALVPPIRFGYENGLVRTFVDEGSAVGLLLSELIVQRDAQSHFSYVNQLVTAIARGVSDPGVSKDPVAAGVLSAREIEILDFMTRGLTNKEIAKALRIAPETVKWHLKHVYEKLHVSSRMQAVQKISSGGSNNGQSGS